jgi:hypothetical protein
MSEAIDERFYDIIEASYFGPEALEFAAKDPYLNTSLNWKIANGNTDLRIIGSMETRLSNHIDENIEFPYSEIFRRALIKNRERQIREGITDGEA